MQNYEKKLLKNIFAEHNMVNLDCLNYPERLVTMIQDAVPKDSQDSSPDKRGIIKKSISANEQLMKFDTIANNKAIQALLNKNQQTPSSSVIDQRQSNDQVTSSKLKTTSTLMRIKSQKDATLNFVDSKGDFKSLFETKTNLKKDDTQQMAKTSGRMKIDPNKLESNDSPNKEKMASEGRKDSATASLKQRNIFSATTKANSLGTQLKTRFADQG